MKRNSPERRYELQVGVSIVIPCLNEAECLAETILQAKEGVAGLDVPSEIIVADNGSSDGSQEIASRMGARVVEVPARGYGNALNFGILAAKYEWVVFADADGSYPFDEIGKLIGPLRARKAELVLGNRLRGSIAPGAMPLLHRFLGTPILSFLIRLFYRLPTRDCNSGMRAFTKSAYERMDPIAEGMEFASEMLIRAGQEGLKYQEVTISFRKDRRSRGPHLRPWRDGWRHLRFILAHVKFRSSVLMPAMLGLLLLAASLCLSVSWGDGPVRFHSAFFALSLGALLLVLATSALIFKAVLVLSNRSDSPVVSFIIRLAGRGVFVFWALIIFLVVLADLGSVVALWIRGDFGPLNELGTTIRVVALTFLTTLLVVLDVSLGVLNTSLRKAHGERRKGEEPKASHRHSKQKTAA